MCIYAKFMDTNNNVVKTRVGGVGAWWMGDWREMGDIGNRVNNRVKIK